MESLMNDLRRNGDSLTTARSLRLPSRLPLHQIFEDHGQSLVSGTQKMQSSGASRRQVSGTQKFKPAIITSEKSKVGPAARSMSARSTTTRNPSAQATIDLSDSQSEDEMDLLSLGRNTVDCPSTSQKRILHTQNDPDKGYFDSDGEWHQYVKGFEPRQRIYSGLKFKKNKGGDRAKGEFSDTAFLQSTQQPTPPFSASQQSASSSKNGICLASTFMGDTIYVSRPLSSKDPNSKPATTSRAKHPPQEKPPSEPKPVTETLKFGPPSRSAHPRIKRTSNRQPTSTSKGQDSSFHVGLVAALLGQSDTEGRSTGSRSCSQRSSPRVSVRKPEAFPTLSPPSSPALPKRQPEIFPPLSPLTDSKSQASGFLRHPKPHAKPFPMLSPSSKGEEVEVSRGRMAIKRIKGKEKMKENGDRSLLMPPDNEDNAGSTIMVLGSLNDRGKRKGRTQPERTTKGTKRRPKEFPMSTQMLQSIDSSPTTVSPPRCGKRLGSGDERISSKRSKKERDLLPQSPTRTFEEEGDSLLFSPEVDPRRLCPYCDTPLPEHPSSLLVGLITATRKKASSDPRPSNPLGLKAPVAVFVTVCQRHRFESQILPEAEKKGWPKTIEWNKLANRIMKMRNALRMLIEDSGDSNAGYVGWTKEAEDDWEVPFPNKKTTGIRKKIGPKANSIFWNELIQEIKEKGSRIVAGVRGQFANFEKAQPGYYGEQGSVIIHQTLYDMFPPSSMNASFIAPLTGNEFMEKILVPEVALRLIMEDRNLEGDEGKQEALTVLRESSSYGVFMFPEDGGEWGGQRRKARENQLGVGDMIVMQRAMKRRKELEEEREEEEERMLQERVTRKRTNDRRNEVSAPTQPTPRPLGKTSNAMSSSQNEFPGSRQPTKQSRSDCNDTDPVRGIETAVEISDSDSEGGSRVALRDRQHSLSAGETRRNGSSMHSTNRAISGLNPSSDTDTSSRAVVGARPLTRSRSRVIAHRAEIRSARKEVDDLMKTPVPKRPNSGLEGDDTPKAPLGRPTPPLMRARQRRNKVSTDPIRQNYGTPKPPLPTRVHRHYNVRGGTSQDASNWLLEDDESS